MSERERWIIYPLLFISFGFALRPHFFSTEVETDLKCRTVICDHLRVKSIATGSITVVDKDEEGKSIKRISLGTAFLQDSDENDKELKKLQSGLIQVYGKDGLPIVVLAASKNETSGKIVTYDKGKPVAILTSEKFGGRLKVIDPKTNEYNLYDVKPFIPRIKF